MLNEHHPKQSQQVVYFFNFFLLLIEFIDLEYLRIFRHLILPNYLKSIHYFQSFSDFHPSRHLINYRIQKIEY